MPLVKIAVQEASATTNLRIVSNTRAEDIVTLVTSNLGVCQGTCTFLSTDGLGEDFVVDIGSAAASLAAYSKATEASEVASMLVPLQEAFDQGLTHLANGEIRVTLKLIRKEPAAAPQTATLLGHPPAAAATAAMGAAQATAEEDVRKGSRNRTKATEDGKRLLLLTDQHMPRVQLEGELEGGPTHGLFFLESTVGEDKETLFQEVVAAICAAVPTLTVAVIKSSINAHMSNVNQNVMSYDKWKPWLDYQAQLQEGGIGEKRLNRIQCNSTGATKPSPPSLQASRRSPSPPSLLQALAR